MTAADPYFSATADSSSWKSAPVSLDKILDQVVWEGRAGFVSRISGAADAERTRNIGLAQRAGSARRPDPCAKHPSENRRRIGAPDMNEPGAATTSRVSKTCQYRPLVRATFRFLLPRSATGKSGR